MTDLKWDGDVEEDDSANEDAMPGDDELIDVTETSSPEPDEVESDDPPENPDDCEHPWSEVTEETMKRSVRGSIIDTKQIYWCDSCKTILDVID